MSRQSYLTKGELTTQALKVLSYRGVYCWRQNNISVPGRKFTGMRGLPDICGIGPAPHSVFVGAEVKTKDDKIRDDQRDFMTELVKRGGIGLLVTEKNGELSIENFPINLK